MKGELTGIKASCGTDIRVGDCVDCYYMESDGFKSQQLLGTVEDKNDKGVYCVDGNDLALTCAPTVDIIDTYDNLID